MTCHYNWIQVYVTEQLGILLKNWEKPEILAVEMETVLIYF